MGDRIKGQSATLPSLFLPEKARIAAIRRGTAGRVPCPLHVLLAPFMSETLENILQRMKEALHG